MKKQLTAATVTAALLALTTSAQQSGPNRTGPGTSPGTIGSSASKTPPTPPPPINNFDTLPPAVNDAPPVINEKAPVINDAFRTQPRPGALAPDGVAGPRNGVLPNTSIGTPDATAPDSTELRTRTFRGSINDSTNWDRSTGGAAESERGSGSGRLTPPPDVQPTPRPLSGSGASRDTLLGPAAESTSRGELNTTGIKVPPRVQEQPLDRSLSAKIRAQLSANSSTGPKPAVTLPPELVRDIRITSQNGRVLLEGMVDTKEQKEMIENRTKEVQGVAAIENRLTVRNQAVGSPARTETGRGETPRATSGESPQNESDLDDSHPEIAPDE